MQDRNWNFEQEEDDDDTCDHRFYGTMTCAYCDESWESWEFEDLRAEVIELRTLVEELKSQLAKEQ